MNEIEDENRFVPLKGILPEDIVAEDVERKRKLRDAKQNVREMF